MSDQKLIAELVRVQALFQARTIAAVMGLPQPVALDDRKVEPPHDPLRYEKP